MLLPRPAPGTARWWVVGVAGCLVAVAVIVWWGITSTVGSVRPEVTGYDVRSDTSVLVEYDLHRPADVWPCVTGCAELTAPPGVHVGVR